ncbi:EAL domain-containing protein [Metabacillus iocasae]|uniref:Diguanylate cyclase (GGDEF)-like protein/PAS domain S-box-containing protein n=1 Tax=Priestia iocasae TaxID=2291674 RepID=A0ABS2QVX8_9BACI|nr:EAL domain-containing protein [Metabacillus iocasae]MBM7702901.1 diguanylate cyclase (GGDEF)-like protein/PAS domain S-box-containing protein [Metabacillus iocasae]
MRKESKNYNLRSMALENSEKRFRLLTEFLPDPVIIYSNGDIIASNRACEHIFGSIQKGASIESSILLHLDSYDISLFTTCLVSQQPGTINPPVKMKLITITGEIKTVEMHSVHILYGEEPAVLFVFRDKTEMDILKQELEFLTYHDFLTGLPNRRWYEQKLDEIILQGEGSPFAIMCVNLNRFKWVNDSIGHRYGDLLLQKVSERLVHYVGPKNIVLRHGGDEFAVIVFASISEEFLCSLAEGIVNEIQLPYSIYRTDVQISCSIGITIYPSDGMDKDVLMRNANLALHKAKKDGKTNWMFFSADMQHEALRKAVTERELNKALENKEFELYYQPLINTITQEVVGLEALIRWNHPTKGMVPPGAFISIAEETGQIISMEKWVIHEACRQMKEWESQGIPPIKIGINLSPIHFQKMNFIQDIKKIVDETQFDPQYIDLEITENLALQDTEKVLEKLQSVKGMHITVSIDDFGTGFSSLLYLKKFPIQTLKIAQEFVRNLEKDAENQSIVTSILALAKAFQLNVVAEGVETIEQLNILRHQQCTYVQGYYYSKPLPAKECFQLLQKPRSYDNR